MSFRRCPGSAAFMQPKIELVRCPQCQQDVEVWSDEADGTCDSCGITVVRTQSQSCVDWCRYARECLGEEKFKQYRETKSAVRKEAVKMLGWVDHPDLERLFERALGDQNRKVHLWAQRGLEMIAEIAPLLATERPRATPPSA